MRVLCLVCKAGFLCSILTACVYILVYKRKVFFSRPMLGVIYAHFNQLEDISALGCQR